MKFPKLLFLTLLFTVIYSIFITLNVFAKDPILLEKTKNNKPQDNFTVEGDSTTETTESTVAEKRTTTSIKDMILVPAGYFTMGSNDTMEDEAPSHEVYLNTFYIDKYEVSNLDYNIYLKALTKKKVKQFKNPVFSEPEHPVVGVTWDEAFSYCKWSKKDLPTEAQWEKAARGTDKRKWPWGNEWKESYKYDNLNLFGDSDHYEFTAPYNYYKAGISYYGVYNMAGNIWEWCLDWYSKDYYKKNINVNPKGPNKGKMKTLRGGSWANDIKDIYITKRIRNYPKVTLDIYGFRCVLNIEK